MYKSLYGGSYTPAPDPKETAAALNYFCDRVERMLKDRVDDAHGKAIVNVEKFMNELKK